MRDKPADLSYLKTYLGGEREVISVPEQLAFCWVASMEWYLEQLELGVPVLAFRYEDMLQSQEATHRSIFGYCDLSQESVQAGLKAFERDAQAGTVLARQEAKESNKLTLNDEQVQSITQILDRHPVLNARGYIAPHTVQIERHD